MAASREPFNVIPHSEAPTQQQQLHHSPWHSPVPYLFGGLAAMLGLIAFALLILACSYWRLSGYLDGDGSSREPDLESGDGKGDENQKRPQPVFEEKILVIMAGEIKPTYLATPMSSRSSSFGDTKSSSSTCSSSSSDKSEKPSGVAPETVKEESTENRETAEPSDQTH